MTKHTEIPADIREKAQTVSDRLFRVGKFINAHVCRDPHRPDSGGFGGRARDPA